MNPIIKLDQSQVGIGAAIAAITKVFDDKIAQASGIKEPKAESNPIRQNAPTVHSLLDLSSSTEGRADGGNSSTPPEGVVFTPTSESNSPAQKSTTDLNCFGFMIQRDFEDEEREIVIEITDVQPPDKSVGIFGSTISIEAYNKDGSSTIELTPLEYERAIEQAWKHVVKVESEAWNGQRN